MARTVRNRVMRVKLEDPPNGHQRNGRPTYPVRVLSMRRAVFRWQSLTSATASSRMLAAIQSAAVLGVEAFNVTVEVDVASGLPAWTIVGLPGGAVKEARERVSAAIVNSGCELPSRRVTEIGRAHV